MTKLSKAQSINIRGGTKSCDFIQGVAIGAAVVNPSLAPGAILVFGVAEWYCS